MPWTWTPTRLARYLQLATTNAYVATVDNTLIGFSIASLGEARAHLVLLAVTREYRQLGIGQRLLQMQLRASQTAGLADMSLEVRINNVTAQQFYAAAGFKQVRVLARYYCGVEDAIRYRMSPIRAQQTEPHKPTSADKR